MRLHMVIADQKLTAHFQLMCPAPDSQGVVEVVTAPEDVAWQKDISIEEAVAIDVDFRAVLFEGADTERAVVELILKTINCRRADKARPGQAAGLIHACR